LAVFDPPDLSLPMIDFATARRNMVDGQVRTQDVTDLRVIDALLAVPREQFLPAAKAGVAYLDDDIALGEGAMSRRLLKPMVLAKFMQLAAPRPGDRVLDIAGGTGYASALWARLVGSVTMLEEDSALAKQAQKNLGGAAKVVTGTLAAGWQANAPYDIILINGACEIEPKPIFGQLADGGRLLCIMGATPGKATLYLRSGNDVSSRQLFDASAPLLPEFARAPAFVF
jgi:protein-L-isoaspartate(D-aspartate) O-methyltransferase